MLEDINTDYKGKDISEVQKSRTLSNFCPLPKLDGSLPNNLS